MTDTNDFMSHAAGVTFAISEPTSQLMCMSLLVFRGTPLKFFALANGKVDYQILGEAEAKPYTSKVEGLTESIYGLIAQSNLRGVLDKVKESSQTQEAPASSQRSPRNVKIIGFQL